MQPPLPPEGGTGGEICEDWQNTIKDKYRIDVQECDANEAK
jgi:hypothetical protein